MNSTRNKSTGRKISFEETIQGCNTQKSSKKDFNFDPVKISGKNSWEFSSTLGGQDFENKVKFTASEHESVSVEN